MVVLPTRLWSHRAGWLLAPLALALAQRLWGCPSPHEATQARRPTAVREQGTRARGPYYSASALESWEESVPYRWAAGL